MGILVRAGLGLNPANDGDRLKDSERRYVLASPRIPVGKMPTEYSNCGYIFIFQRHKNLQLITYERIVLGDTILRTEMIEEEHTCSSIFAYFRSTKMRPQQNETRDTSNSIAKP